MTHLRLEEECLVRSLTDPRPPVRGEALLRLPDLLSVDASESVMPSKQITMMEMSSVRVSYCSKQT